MSGLKCLNCDEHINMEAANRKHEIDVYQGPEGTQQFTLHVKCRECSTVNFLACEGHVYDMYND